MEELLTVVTRKGQITLPVEIRRTLGIKEGDKVAVSLVPAVDGEEPRVVLRPVRSVAEMTFGAVPARKEPVDLDEMRHLFEEDVAAKVLANLYTEAPDG
jgi:AbrB family looped-hinge helix DNA binding protein